MQQKKERKKERIRWDEVNARIGDYQFCRMFRMDRACFRELCFAIIGAVGESKFKSQAYIDAFLKGGSNMYNANILSVGGYISGEIKLAITIRILAGGSALDLAVIFYIYPTHISAILNEVLINWIIKPNIGKINMKSIWVIRKL